MPDVTFTINGTGRTVDVDVRLLLVEALREKLGLTGPRIGCRTGDCGACTIRLDGATRKSCLILAVAADGAEITTLDGLADGDELHPLQRAFREEHAFQCGFCLSGMVLAAQELLEDHTRPDQRPDRRRPARQPLPLHGLPQHLPGGAPSCRRPGTGGRRPDARISPQLSRPGVAPGRASPARMT